ncbi:membrane-bound PQQ-dependent dehydrogenase, glucose/quinate/shikimate family, partial [Pseudomonas sp. SIMBA_068]
PWVVRPLYQGQRRFHPFLGGSVVLMVLLVIGLCFYDPLPQQGAINTPRNASATGGAAEEWSAYGGTTDGQRFSALKQIT